MTLVEDMSNAVEQKLRKQIFQLNSSPDLAELETMMEYHLGWKEQGEGPEVRGKTQAGPGYVQACQCGIMHLREAGC